MLVHNPFKFLPMLVVWILCFVKPGLGEEDTSDVIITTTLTEASTTITTTTKSESPTLIWVTGTNEEGVLQTSQSAYTEVFKSFYTSVQVPPQGSIGLGTIQGTIGTVRKYPSLTVKPRPTT